MAPVATFPTLSLSLSLSQPLIRPNMVTLCVTLPNLKLADSSSFLPSFLPPSSLPLSYCPHSQPNNVTATASTGTDKIASAGTAASQSDISHTKCRSWTAHLLPDTPLLHSRDKSCSNPTVLRHGPCERGHRHVTDRGRSSSHAERQHCKWRASV